MVLLLQVTQPQGGGDVLRAHHPLHPTAHVRRRGPLPEQDGRRVAPRRLRTVSASGNGQWRHLVYISTSNKKRPQTAR